MIDTAVFSRTGTCHPKRKGKITTGTCEEMINTAAFSRALCNKLKSRLVQLTIISMEMNNLKSCITIALSCLKLSCKQNKKHMSTHYPYDFIPHDPNHAFNYIIRSDKLFPFKKIKIKRSDKLLYTWPHQ